MVPELLIEPDRADKEAISVTKVNRKEEKAERETGSNSLLFPSITYYDKEFVVVGDLELLLAE